MLLLYDIGGTNFRFYIYDDNNELKLEKKTIRDKDVLDQLLKSLSTNVEKYNITKIVVSIAGIVDNYKIYGCKNAGIADGTNLLRIFDIYVYPKNYDEMINSVEIKYINDGDAFVLGEIDYNNIDMTNKNILGVIFGTGVGSGLIMNGKLVKNCEIHNYIEPFMKSNNLNSQNLIKVFKFLANEFSKLVELLNLDFIIINGYIKNYSICENIILRFMSYNKYFKPKLIFSDCNNSIERGLLTL
mgnify:CR=1 FL=1